MPVGARYAGENGASGALQRGEHFATPVDVEHPARWNGSTNVPGSASTPTTKWPGIPTPCNATPMRRPTSIIRMLNVIGIPSRRSITSSSSELRGSE